MFVNEVWTEHELPPLLKDIPDKPSNLYVKYKTFSKDIFENCLAVVGSRRMTEYGERVISRVIPEVAGQGVAVVSGFMFGADAWAHRTAVESGGRSIAVMPCGIDRIVPAYQKDLYEAILVGQGLVMSEYESDAPSQKWMFTKRNRIVAGLCKAVLIVEAEEDSGSLITASYAKKYGRKVFAIPGSIFSSKSKGCNKLIKEGAFPVESASDILSYYDIKSIKNFTRDEQGIYSDSEAAILNLLAEESTTVDDIVRSTGVDVREVSSLLLALMLKGVVGEKGGVWHVV